MTISNEYLDQLCLKNEIELKMYELHSKVANTLVYHLGYGYSPHPSRNQTALIQKEYNDYCEELHKYIVKEAIVFNGALSAFLKNRNIKVFSLDLKKYDELAKKPDAFLSDKSLNVYYSPGEAPNKCDQVHETLGQFKLEEKDVISLNGRFRISEKALNVFSEKYKEKLVPSLQIYKDGSALLVKKTFENVLKKNDLKEFIIDLKILTEYKKGDQFLNSTLNLSDLTISHFAIKRLKNHLSQVRAGYKEILTKAHECNQLLSNLSKKILLVPPPYKLDKIDVVEEKQMLILSEKESYSQYLALDSFLENEDGFFSGDYAESLGHLKNVTVDFLEPFHQLCDVALTDPESLKKIFEYPEFAFSMVDEGNPRKKMYHLIDESPPSQGVKYMTLYKKVDIMSYKECVPYLEAGRGGILATQKLVEELVNKYTTDYEVDDIPYIFGRDVFGSVYQIEYEFTAGFALSLKSSSIPISSERVVVDRNQLNSMEIEIYLNKRYVKHDYQSIELLRRFEIAKEKINNLMHLTKCRFKRLTLSNE